ncbi:hypothetical protein [Formosa sp. A9]|uniref:hypothetical protein n=1 Tax=Formosa sp. A9 TaxID=3442641 RepID=UPI003EBFC5FF
MKKITLFVFLSFVSSQINAQLIKQKSIDASIGIGVSFPYDDVPISDCTGFYLKGDYVLTVSKWIDLRPYAGIILTYASGEDENGYPTDYETTTKAMLLGGKARLKIPIPWFAPYLEGGIGTSIGSFKTYTLYDNIDRGGLAVHFPITLGVGIGPNHNYNLALSYYMQPDLKQVLGAIAFGATFPI